MFCSFEKWAKPATQHGRDDRGVTRKESHVQTGNSTRFKDPGALLESRSVGNAGMYRAYYTTEFTFLSETRRFIAFKWFPNIFFYFRSVEFSIRLFSCHFRISKLVQGQLVFASHAWKPSLDFFILSSDFVLVALALSLINADMNPLHLKVQIKERRWEKKRRTNSDYFFIAFQYLCLGRRYVMIEFVVWPECVYFTVICCILRCRSQTPE